MKSEFALAFNQICAQYGLPREVVLDAVRAALATAYRRDWKVPSTQNVAAEISLETGLARIFVERTVVDEVEDEEAELALHAARRKKPGVEVGDIIMVDVTPEDFGRIAAQTAKQVITQRLREAERESQFHRFSRQENEIIIGTVQSVNPHGVTLHLERTEEAHMPRREQIPGERYVLHQKIRVYVLEVRRTPRGPDIIVSRSHPLMLRRLLELEVPEIRTGQVEINAVAREAGTRAKVAVSTRQPGVDPVGACVGMRGIRIQTISRELHGERIDVVEWDEEPDRFISNALSIPKVVTVIPDETNPGGRTASVVVLDDHLSLAIGRSGQNARLAAKLTNWRVDIQGATEAAMWALEQVNTTPDLLDAIKNTATFIPRLASIVRAHEEDRYPYTDEELRVIGTVVKAVREAIIARRDAERPGASQARARQRAQQRVEADRVKAREAAQARVPRGAYKVPISEIDLPEKVYSNLISNGLRNLGEVMERMALGDEALLMLNGVGVKALAEIKEAVDESGLKLREHGEGEESVAEETLAEDVEVAETAEASTLDEESEAQAVAEAADDLVTVEIEAPSETEEEAAESAEVSEEADAEEEPATEEGLKEEEEPALAEELDFSDVVDEESDIVYEEEDELPEDEIGSPKKQSRNKRRRRAILVDEQTGETYVVHRHRSSNRDVWDELSEDY